MREVYIFLWGSANSRAATPWAVYIVAVLVHRGQEVYENRKTERQKLGSTETC